MLQSRMCSHVASRLILQAKVSPNTRGIMNPTSMGPMKVKMDNARKELKITKLKDKHFLCNGDRSVAMAAHLLQQGKIIAIPTDTVYGLACLATDTEAIQRLYKIKNRDEKKPLAICLSNVNEMGTWGVLDNIPPRLIETLLPGPYTICLQRTPALNSALNPNLDSIGIRVPNKKFVRCVAQIVGPIALTSANHSGEPSSLHPDEFRLLWPEIDGIFYDISKQNKIGSNYRRIGSTVVDLSQLGCYRIVRHGIQANIIIGTLRKFGLQCNSEY